MNTIGKKLGYIFLRLHRTLVEEGVLSSNSAFGIVPLDSIIESVDLVCKTMMITDICIQ